MPPAARLTDMHVCPSTAPVPHGGGPIAGPGVPNVLIGGLPAAVVQDLLVCTGTPPLPPPPPTPPDMISKGSATVLIGGRPAARIGDPCQHGGVIVSGFPMVEIGG